MATWVDGGRDWLPEAWNSGLLTEPMQPTASFSLGGAPAGGEWTRSWGRSTPEGTVIREDTGPQRPMQVAQPPALTCCMLSSLSQAVHFPLALAANFFFWKEGSLLQRHQYPLHAPTTQKSETQWSNTCPEHQGATRPTVSPAL